MYHQAQQQKRKQYKVFDMILKKRYLSKNKKQKVNTSSQNKQLIKRQKISINKYINQLTILVIKMEKLVELLEKNKKLVGLTAAAAAAVGLIFYFTQKGQKVQQGTNEQDEEVGTANETQYLQKAKQIAKKITIKTIGDTKNFDMNTISQVMEYSLELADQEYVDLTLKNRKDRREKMTEDINEYERLILQYNEDVENIIKKAQSTILEILEIPYEDFEESVIAFMEKGHYQELYMFQAAVRQKIKEKLKPTKNLGIDEVKKIITFQLNLLQQQPELLKSIIKKLSQSNETVQLIPVILGTLINDYIYKEYEVEEEDQMQVMAQPSFLEDTDMIILIQQVEQAMFQAMGAMGSMEGGMFE
ncbi:hypothetical protein ABPG74_000690 [Tetrahymena malaccensis]